MARERTELGKFLAKTRIDHNIPLREFAKGVGISSPFLCALETGGKSLPFDRAMTISQYLRDIGADCDEFKRLVLESHIAKAFPMASKDLIAQMTKVAYESINF